MRWAFERAEWPAKVRETPWRENRVNKKTNTCKLDWQKCLVFWFQQGIHEKNCCVYELLLEVESLILVFMLTWAPVELNNFCNVIGVTKEGFLVFLYI